MSVALIRYYSKAFAIAVSSVELSATIYRSNGHDAHRWQCMYEKCKRGDMDFCPGWVTHLGSDFLLGSIAIT